MKRTLLFIAITAIGMSSCLITEDLEDPNNKELSPINFANGRVIGSTKANDKTTSWDGDEVVGIFAMKTEAEIVVTAFSPNFANNLKLTNGAASSGNGTWTPGSMLYWPANSGDRITFFAYHPYVAAGGSGKPVVSETDGRISIQHTVAADPAGQTDLLWAWVVNAHKDDMDGNGPLKEGQTAVPFAFKHALTKISFSASTTMETSGIKSIRITSLTITASSSNTATTTASDPLEWSNSAATASVKFQVVESGDASYTVNIAEGGDITGFTTKDHELLMVPQDHPNEGTKNKIIIGYSIEYNEGAIVEGYVAEYSLSGKWEPNAHVKYNFNITAKGILFEPSTTDWVAGAQPPLQ